jgi:hypothetical protein
MHPFRVTTLFLMIAALLPISLAGCGQSTSPLSPSTSCAYALSLGPTVDADSHGGTFSVTVTTTPSTGCTWSVVSSAGWIHVTAGGSGTGSGTFAFSVDTNTGPARSGTLAVAGRVVTLNQTAATTPSPTPACSFTLTVGTMVDGYPDGGMFSVGITTTTGCNWTAASNASWIHILGGASGSGSGATIFDVDANTGPPRVGTLVIANETITFNQSSK